MDNEARAALYALSFPDDHHHWRADDFAAFDRAHNVTIFERQSAMAILRIVADEAEILTICVAPDARRAGLASELMREIIVHSTQQNVARIFLEVAKDNRAALDFYRKHGFTEQGSRRNYYRRKTGQRVDALILRRDLAHFNIDPR